MPKKRFLRWIILIGAAISAMLILMIADVQLRYLDRIKNVLPSFEEYQMAVVLVLGASVTGGGLPSDALKDRLDTGVDLYRTGAGQIMISGDDGRYQAREIPVMKAYLIAQGVPERDIFVDGEGYRTYESCKHAATQRHGRRVILVTQRFHLGRALYLCNRMGVNAIGHVADRQHYRRIIYFWARDILASVKAWWDFNIQPPKSPVSG